MAAAGAAITVIATSTDAFAAVIRGTSTAG
jgi:hypothetical protein